MPSVPSSCATGRGHNWPESVRIPTPGPGWVPTASTTGPWLYGEKVPRCTTELALYSCSFRIIRRHRRRYLEMTRVRASGYHRADDPTMQLGSSMAACDRHGNGPAPPNVQKFASERC